MVVVIARVEPLTRTRSVRGPFDYLLRSDHGAVQVGSLLRVPFSGRPSLGVVVELASHSELAPEQLAEPDAVLPAGIPPDLVTLARWMAPISWWLRARSLRYWATAGKASASPWKMTRARSCDSSDTTRSRG